MKLRVFPIFIFILVIGLISGSSISFAKSVQSLHLGYLAGGPGDSSLNHPQSNRIYQQFTPSPRVGVAQNSQPQVNLGQPGLSYRYVNTIGVPGIPYLEDVQHLNHPWGLFMDSSNNLYVVEEQGCRLLKYDQSGNNLLVIGSSGRCYTDDYSFGSLQDVALDGSGNIWVADGNRVIQYSPTGTFLQQQPATEPWVSGNDNERFENVHGVAFDNAGRMYVSDTDNQRIQVYSFVSGSPVYSTTIGITDSPGSGANQFHSPWRIAIDSLGRLHVVDKDNNRVRRCSYTSGWTCSTLDSSLNNPQGISIDQANNVFIADTENARIRKCTFAGVCSTFAQDTYGWYRDLAVDTLGNVYGSAPWKAIVVKHSSSGALLGTFLGIESVPYLTDNYHFNRPRIAIDASDNIIVVEENGERLLKLDPSGAPLWAVGVPGVDASDNVHFNFPHGVAVDKDGRIYVADGCRVQIFNSNGSFFNTLGTGCGNGDYQFDWAAGISVDDNGNIYVADAPNDRVMIYDTNRVKIGQIGTTGLCSSAENGICYPLGLETDSTGNLYVADADNCRVQKFNSTHVYQMTFGNSGSCTTSLLDIGPEDIAVDALGRVYVSTWDNNRVQVFSSTGDYLTTIGGSWGANSSQFRFTSGVDIDSKGNVFIADFNNSRIQIFTPGVPNWLQKNINGFGNRWNEAVWSLEEFNGNLYAGTTNWQEGAQVWQSPDGTSWIQVSDPGFSSTYGSDNAVIGDMIVFDGALYASTGNWGTSIGQVWRTTNGTTWISDATAGFGNPDNQLIGAFGILSDTLYTTAYNNTDGGEIWRKPKNGNWEPVVSGGNGNSNNTNITSFTEFNGAFYAAVENVVDGCEIWRSENGLTWTPVRTGGFGSSHNTWMSGFAVYDGFLYIGMTNTNTGAQIWRSSNGSTWLPVIQDGFGDLDNESIESLISYRNALYTSTDNNTTGVKIWKSKDGMNWQQINTNGFGDSNNSVMLWNSGAIIFSGNLYFGMYNSANGGEIWQLLFNVFLPNVSR